MMDFVALALYATQHLAGVGRCGPGDKAFGFFLILIGIKGCPLAAPNTKGLLQKEKSTCPGTMTRESGGGERGGREGDKRGREGTGGEERGGKDPSTRLLFFQFRVEFYKFQDYS